MNGALLFDPRLLRSSFSRPKTRQIVGDAEKVGTLQALQQKAAQQGGWSDAQLADAFAQLGLTVFAGYFLNYAQTEPDV